MRRSADLSSSRISRPRARVTLRNRTWAQHRAAEKIGVAAAVEAGDAGGPDGRQVMRLSRVIGAAAALAGLVMASHADAEPMLGPIGASSTVLAAGLFNSMTLTDHN